MHIARDDNSAGGLGPHRNGLGDLQNRLFAHTPAFWRIRYAVRVARFAARYTHLGFHIADEALNDARDDGHAGELLT